MRNKPAKKSSFQNSGPNKGDGPAKEDVDSREWPGNPVFEGWYADPEVIVYNDKYWIFPTFSAEYEKQIKFDCFSSRTID